MKKIEILQPLQGLYREQLNPELYSLKFCQSNEKVCVEMYFSTQKNSPSVIDLNFIGGEIVKDENGFDQDILPLFIHTDDIVDNAKKFIQLDAETLAMCIDHLFTPDAAKKIVYKKNLMSISKSDYNFFYTCVCNHGLKEILVEWDYFGGLEYQFTPDISTDEQKEIEELFESIFENQNFIWNQKFVVINHSASLLEFQRTEIRNLSDYSDASFSEKDIMDNLLAEYILSKFGIDAKQTGFFLEISCKGDASGITGYKILNISTGSFGDEFEIDLSKDQLMKSKVFSSILSFVKKETNLTDQSFDFEFDYSEGTHNLTVFLKQENFILTV